MRLLADENLDPQIIQALRAEGYDVRAIRETDPAAPDDRVIEIAQSENRILLTEDKDFGGIVYERAQPSPGVILVRRFHSASKRKSDEVVNAFKKLGNSLAGEFVVIEPGRIRAGRKLLS